MAAPRLSSRRIRHDTRSLGGPLLEGCAFDVEVTTRALWRKPSRTASRGVAPWLTCAWQRALARGQAGNFPVLLVDGTVAGVWHLKRTGKKIAITVGPLGQLNAGALRELDSQVGRIGEILQTSAQLTIGPITVGPHA